MNPGEREDLYISRFMSRLKRFAIEHMVSVNLVAHQATPQVNKDENYPEPNLFRIKGGGTFADKTDNVLVVWRENRNTNRSDTLVKFISQKIKKQKLTGEPGTAEIDFDRRSNRYREINNSYPIDRLLHNDSQLNIERSDFQKYVDNKSLQYEQRDRVGLFEEELKPLPDADIPF
jgi:hypothetical protein